MILGLIALGLLFLPASPDLVPALLTRAMLLVLVGLAVTVARASVGAGDVAHLPSTRILILIGLEVLLVVMWIIWVLNVGGIREYVPQWNSAR